MKLRTAFKMSLSGSVILLAFAYCTDPTKIYKLNDATEITEDRSETLAQEKGRRLKIDSTVSFRLNLNEYTNRIIEIENHLNQFKSELDAESKLTLALGNEVFQFNKKILELKVQIRESLNYPSTSWASFEAMLAEELDIMEASIADFKKRSGENKI